MQRPHDDLIVVRGAGDIATGVVWRLFHAGFRVLLTELSSPLSIRRSVSLSTAITEGVVGVEGLIGRRCDSNAAIERCWAEGEIPLTIAPKLAVVHQSFSITGVVDARLAKRPLDTTISDAPVVVGLGPGFIVGQHCHAVVETMRGHRLGRAIFHGSAEPDTGSPGVIDGKSAERVLRATQGGTVTWSATIGEWVETGTEIGIIDGEQVTPVVAPFTGMVRGLISSGFEVSPGLKIADLDPRNDPAACHQISDKALAVGGGAVEAIQRLSAQR